MKARVFLSYARADGKDACDFFQKSLTNAGYCVWRDIDNLPGGAFWRQGIEDAIKQVDAVLLFVTPGAKASENVTAEWQTAIRLSKRLVPLVVAKTEMPPELLRYNFRDITTNATYQLEPSLVQKDFEDERLSLRNNLQQICSQINATVSETKRKYLETFIETLNGALSAEFAAFPPEVFKMLFHLLLSLQGELAAGRDITPLVESMASGKFSSDTWEWQSVYQSRISHVEQILRRVRDALPSISLPVVLVAMTQSEALDLASGDVFAGLPVEWAREFDALKPNLPPSWTDRYGSKPEEWKPFATEETIASLIQGEFRELNNKIDTPLRPSFIDIRALRDNRQLLLTLRANACLVVIDAISTWHPRLHAAFRASNLDVSANSLVVRFTTHQTLAQIQPSVGFLLREWLQCEFFQRAYIDKDAKCETVSEEFAVRKWIFNQVKEVVPALASKSEMRPYVNKFGG